jgi:hypothetical protein
MFTSCGALRLTRAPRRSRCRGRRSTRAVFRKRRNRAACRVAFRTCFGLGLDLWSSNRDVRFWQRRRDQIRNDAACDGTRFGPVTQWASQRSGGANADVGANALAGWRADASKRWGAGACRASTVWRSGHASLAHGRRRWRAVVVHCGPLVPRGPLNSAYASRRTCHRFFCNADTAFGERGMR